MTPTNTTSSTFRSSVESGKDSMVRVEASAGAMDRAPQYVDSVIHELRQAVARARCPVHDCGAALTVDFGSRDQGSLKVVAHNCCPILDEMVARALRVYPLFRLQVPRKA